jgi:hypothetical protein
MPNDDNGRSEERAAARFGLNAIETAVLPVGRELRGGGGHQLFTFLCFPCARPTRSSESARNSAGGPKRKRACPARTLLGRGPLPALRAVAH